MISNGIDLVEISRIEKSIQSEGFKHKVFGEDELKYLEGKKAQSYAAAFAAKEAFGKAMGTGIVGFSLSEVQVLHESTGKPYFKLSGRAKALCESKGYSLALSLTHTEKYAAAMVTAYTEK